MLNPQFSIFNATTHFTFDRQDPPKSEPAKIGTGETPKDPNERANILLVDDTPENLVALEAVLAELGQNLVKARSGEEALRLLLRHDFAVILLDVNMPGLNGFETAEMIRQRKSTEHTPIIFVSAISTSDTHLFKGYALGAVDYIFTPVIPDVLRSKVNVFVELLKKTEEAKRQAEQIRQIEEREHEQRLKEAARYIELQTKQNRFFTLSVDLLAIAGFNGSFKEVNPAWTRILGWPEAELHASPFWAKMETADRTLVPELLRQAIELKQPVHFEACFRCLDGSFRLFSWTVAPYGAEELLYLFGRDITERKRTEQEIKQLNQTLEQRANQLQSANADLQAEIASRRQAEEALQESNSALEAFSYSVSHDLRAPIRAMQGFARVLLEDYGAILDEMGKECATRIVSAAERMDTLVQDLLVYSRLGHTTLQLRQLPIQEVILETLGQLEGEIRSRQAIIEVAESLPIVMAHEVTLTQIFINLISNAMKFVGKDIRPHIRIFSEQDGEFTRITVTDNGIGISLADLSRIFRVFERLHGADDYPGTGLGLAIVKKGVERMGGQAGVESELGKGSKFWLRLKLSDRVLAG